MPSYTIWHNPRCSKSRQTLDLLQQHGIEPKVVLYLETPPSVDEIKSVLKKLNLSAEQIIRKKEMAYAELIHGKSLSADKLVEIMHKNPILIERPIVISGNQAAIGRPPENILELMK